MEGYAINKKGKTEKNKKIKTGSCLFPFKYKGQTYNECLDTPSGKICATELNPKNGIMTKYGYCEQYGISQPRRKKSTVKKAPKAPSPPMASVPKASVPKARTPSPPKASVSKGRTPSPLKKTIKLKKKLRIINTNLKPLSVIKSNMHVPTVQVPTVQVPTVQQVQKRWNEPFIKILEELADIMMRQGEPFKARAYQKAQESIMTYEGDIYNLEQIINLPGIGKTIASKLEEYMQTGTLRILERERTNPVNLLTKVYGIGPKKALKAPLI